MNINQILEEFGLQNKENDVYLACLELGTSSAQEIAVKASIKRTTAYDVLANLQKKGLIGQTVKGKKRFFFAEEPEKLKKLLEEKQRKLSDLLPYLNSIYNTAGSKPKVRYHEGKEGLKVVYRDTLNYSGELCAFVTENIISHLGKDFADEYRKKRKRAQLFAKVIGPDNKEIREYKKTDEKSLKETRLVDKEKFPFSIEMNIYGNKVAFMSFKEEMGIIIESNEIAKNMRLLFDLAWESAEK